MQECKTLNLPTSPMSSKLLTFFLILLLYAFLLLAINIFHFQWLYVQVVLYDTILDAFIALGCTVLILVLAPRKRSALSNFEKSQTLTICIMGGLLYALTIPTIIDRSLSVYLLEKIAQRGGSVRQSALEDVFAREYMREHRLIDIRLTEALKSGTLTISEGCVALTPRGKQIAYITRLYRTHFLPKRREIMGEITDDLTDPFRRSDSPAQSECQSLNSKQ